MRGMGRESWGETQVPWMATNGPACSPFGGSLRTEQRADSAIRTSVDRRTSCRPSYPSPSLGAPHAACTENADAEHGGSRVRVRGLMRTPNTYLDVAEHRFPGRCARHGGAPSGVEAGTVLAVVVLTHPARNFALPSLRRERGTGSWSVPASPPARSTPWARVTPSGVAHPLSVQSLAPPSGSGARLHGSIRS